LRQRTYRILSVTVVLALGGCGAESGPEPVTPSTTGAADSAVVEDIWDQPSLQPVEPGTYFMDPDLDPATPMRVVYDIEADGWSQWAGGYKPFDGGHVGLSIATVRNLVNDGCTDHSHADPPIGPTVDDLAAALTNLAPFQVSLSPEDVTIYGYEGKHLELTVPDLPVEPSGDGFRFSDCVVGQLMSWVAPWDTSNGDAFYGYSGPGYSEEFWILDVDGTRLMIAAERSPDAPQEALDELQAVLDSVRIEP
jgi:hypothetical protein